ncbi:MAG: hypothetical protein LBH50_06580, partial [Spirochaetaceae bacterium]|nr:hypothetical protein [Spirochaetaceae bacterium]
MQVTNENRICAVRKDAAALPRYLFFGIFCVLFLFLSGTDVFAFGKKQAGGRAENGEYATDENSVADNDGSAGRTGDPTPAGRIAGLIEAGDIDGAKTAYVTLNDANAVDSNGRNAVHFAAAARNGELADFFIRLGTAADAEDRAGYTPLNISAELLDGIVPPVLIRNGAHIHHSPPVGASPAAVSIESNDSVFLRSLLSRESMLSTDSEGRTILHLAAA